MSKTNYSIYRLNVDPGPGSYRLPSEFGQYDGNVYGKTQYFARNKRYWFDWIIIDLLFSLIF